MLASCVQTLSLEAAHVLSLRPAQCWLVAPRPLRKPVQPVRLSLLHLAAWRVEHRDESEEGGEHAADARIPAAAGGQAGCVGYFAGRRTCACSDDTRYEPYPADYVSSAHDLGAFLLAPWGRAPVIRRAGAIPVPPSWLHSNGPGVAQPQRAVIHSARHRIKQPCGTPTDSPLVTPAIHLISSTCETAPSSLITTIASTTSSPLIATGQPHRITRSRNIPPTHISPPTHPPTPDCKRNRLAMVCSFVSDTPSS